MRPLTDCKEKEQGLNIEQIIINRSLKVEFQPVISISRKKTIGIEGLIRGVDATNQVIMPKDLFDAAKIGGVTLDLDRVCRDEVIKAFGHIYEQNKDTLLFLNIDASILDIAAGTDYLINQVKSNHIDPKNIVIEINETKVQDNAVLKRFTDTYRKYGFMVALDDVGTGSSNMDRILLVKPNIIKVDISLVRNIHNDYFKQGIFKSLVNLCNRIGALVVAEGVESEEEAIQVLRLGGQMIQGYYFAKPKEIRHASDISFDDQVNRLGKRFNQYMDTRTKDERKKNRQINGIANDAVKELSNVSYDAFNDKLLKIIWANKMIECAYILNEHGTQVSDTIRFCDEKKVNKSPFFYSSSLGTDHSMDRYYYPLISAGLTKYITEPYVSLATGNLCITISKIFTNVDDQRYILCMDFNTSIHSQYGDLSSGGNASDLLLNINEKSVAEMSKMIEKMSEEMIKDQLTGTYNRKYIEERLLVDIFNASNQNQPISVIMADLDHFKNVNDTYGHMAGDHVLKAFVNIVKQQVKEKNWIARYGGEEFLVVLFNADEKAAYRIAEKVRHAVEESRIRYNQKDIRITASFGTYTLNSPKITYEQLIERADKNLYAAKNSGRNKTISFQNSLVENMNERRGK